MAVLILHWAKKSTVWELLEYWVKEEERKMVENPQLSVEMIDESFIDTFVTEANIVFR